MGDVKKYDSYMPGLNICWKDVAAERYNSSLAWGGYKVIWTSKIANLQYWNKIKSMIWFYRVNTKYHLFTRKESQNEELFVMPNSVCIVFVPCWISFSQRKKSGFEF